MRLGNQVAYSIEELSQMFAAPRPDGKRVSAASWRRYIKSGQLAGRKVGGSWYVTERALQNWLEGKPAQPEEPIAGPMLPI